MQNHGPKRVYTPHSLEFWFNRFEHNWEAYFTPEQLERGHSIYREGEVRELELTATDAIVHRRIEKKDEYAVIEWAEKGFSVRSSTTDTDAAHALAVAGLHEIEELVADEISPLPESTPPFPAEVGAGSFAVPAAPAAAPSTERKPVNGAAPAPASPAASASGRPTLSAGAGSARASSGVSVAAIGIVPNTLPLSTRLSPWRSTLVTCISSDLSAA